MRAQNKTGPHAGRFVIAWAMASETLAEGDAVGCRRAPGLGLIAFGEIFQALKRISYDGFVSAELLPLPTPDEAARITMEHSLSLSHF